MPPISLCSRIRLSAPISEKLGVYALRQVGEQPLSRISLPLLKRPSRIDALLVARERRELVVGQELELGDADAVLAGDDAAERARERHDAHDDRVRRLQHRVVVGVDRDVRVHVAVARVHVQRDEHAAAQHALVDRDDALAHRPEREAVEDVVQRRLQLALPRHDDLVALQRRERLVEPVEQVLPARAHGRDQLARLRDLRVDQLLRRLRVVLVGPDVLERRRREAADQRVGELELVRDRQLDVDALDAVGVVAEPLERDDDVLVDLERVRVLGDRRRAAAVGPELLARVGATRR